MKKTYEAATNQGYLMTGLNVKGRPTNVKFDDGQLSPRVVNNKFTTEDPEIQKAIEASKQFRNGFLKCIKTVGEEISPGIADASGEKPVALEPKTEKKEEKKVEEKHKKILKYKSWQQVHNYLVTKMNVDPKELNTPAEIKAVAAKKNLVLPKLD